MRKQMVAAVCAGILILGLVSTAEAALVGRLETAPSSGVFQAYYDTDLDITWAADANINGQDTWANQLAWAAGVTIGGVSGWRLPTSAQPDSACSLQGAGGSSGSNCTGSELGHLFYTELGNPYNTPPVNTGNFSNVQPNFYWTSTEFNSTQAYAFRFSFGDQGLVGKETAPSFAWAVYDGDVALAAVPAPAALLLMASGLVGLVAIRRWTKTA